ncbi:hypothetical protein [Umezawaea beigongshangensis]|uniref:hypothetical protein n=1 Tax=Umezawaea beigongshangensis TaxID=2780383 RepID=UPI0018F10A4E|nr:hypothetical protein [Umezawaea beigongshangensis]
MAPRASWAVTIDEDTGLISVVDARLSMSALWTPTGPITSRTGLVPAGSEPGRVTATAPTPNGEVHMSPFRAVLVDGRSGGGGTYTLTLDEVEDIDVLGTAPADPADPRVDLIVWQQSDTYHGDPDSQLRIRHVVGDPAPVPTDPEVDGSPNYLARARITVPAGASALTNSDIEHVALPYTVATGGVLPIYSEAEREAIDAPWDGMTIYRYDRLWLEVYDTGDWVVQGVAVCASVSDRASAITSPRGGQCCVTTDTDTLWQYDAPTSTWLRMGSASAPRGLVYLYSEDDNPAWATFTSADTVIYSKTVAVEPRRVYQLDTCGPFKSSSAGTGIELKIHVGGTKRFSSLEEELPSSGLNRVLRARGTYVTGASETSLALQVRALRLSGTGTVTPGAFTDQPFELSVMDIGGTSGALIEG